MKSKSNFLTNSMSLPISTMLALFISYFFMRTRMYLKSNSPLSPLNSTSRSPFSDWTSMFEFIPAWFWISESLSLELELESQQASMYVYLRYTSLMCTSSTITICLRWLCWHESLCMAPLMPLYWSQSIMSIPKINLIKNETFSNSIYLYHIIIQ